jgi:hypothetical protein
MVVDTVFDPPIEFGVPGPPVVTVTSIGPDWELCLNESLTTRQ